MRPVDADKVIEKIRDMMEEGQCRHKFCDLVTEEQCAEYANCEECVAERIIEVIESELRQGEDRKNG